VVSRRSFVQAASVACIAQAMHMSEALSLSAAPSSSPSVRLGLVVWVPKGNTPEAIVRRVSQLGFSTCQIGFEALDPSLAPTLRSALSKYGVEATALLELGPGRRVWNFYEGPLTIGLVPTATRAARIQALKTAADVAAECNIAAIHTHCGFIPENPNDPTYKEVVSAIHDVASHCKQRNRMMLCETGQETPITLLRMIEDVGLDNVAVNLDMANLILYGKGNPVDAMDVIGSRVRGLHAKDGLFPVDPKNLGKEVPIGQGKVDFRRVVQRLHDFHYQGAITIEREIEGDKQTQDILASKAYLEKIISEVYGGSHG
jgi:L-ribulose-5-phosphate 3-epimerase